MDCFPDKRDSLRPAPAFSHHHHHHHNHHHHFLEVSPHCPQHGGYVSHHHHHLALSPNCPLHRHLLVPHSQIQTNFPSFPFPTNPNFNIINSEAHTVNSTSEPLMIQERNEEVELENGEEEEIIFVLTDEWKDFFAKSEAKRRLAKKQAKKKCKT